MKTIKLTAIIFAIIFAGVASAEKVKKNRSNELNERRTLVLAGDYWCPYNCHPDSNLPGYLVELIRRSLYIYRIDVEYRMMPWSEALDLAEKGEVDGLIGISNVRGKNLVTTRLPLEHSIIEAFTRNDTEWKYDGINSLRGQKVGIILDYDLDEDVSHYVGINYPLNPGGFSVQEGKNAVIESIADLIDGDSDVYLEDMRVVKSYLNEHGLRPYIRNAGHAVKTKMPVYIAFSKDLPNVKNYIKYFTEGMASMKATGELDDIRAKYKMDAGEIDEL
jgi:polar amino acid transport system substrate-binding protein